jgi:hypothetical protein
MVVQATTGLFLYLEYWLRYAIGKPGSLLRLANGRIIRYRRLRLYELDIVPFDDPGPFRYPYKLSNGQTVERIYDISQWPEPPTAPATPEHLCSPDSYEAALWQVFNTYQAALSQRIKQIEATEQYAHDVAKYVIENCVTWGRSEWFTEPEDYTSLYQRVIYREVTLQEVEAALAATFPGFIRRQAIFTGSV